MFESCNIFCEPTPVLLDPIGGNGGGGGGVPANAMLDGNGNPVLDDEGNYVLSN
ncbi:MAG TPA: hypothetical protein VK742_08350 [Candidatus Sulfotelmatobacter sp.]|nr:hypothetical protein [Candidatus Sulfotelmatobacter sp.]